MTKEEMTMQAAKKNFYAAYFAAAGLQRRGKKSMYVWQKEGSCTIPSTKNPFNVVIIAKKK